MVSICRCFCLLLSYGKLKYRLLLWPSGSFIHPLFLSLLILRPPPSFSLYFFFSACKWVHISPHLSFALVLLVNPWSTSFSFSVKLFEPRLNTWGPQGRPCCLPHKHPRIPELPLPPTPTLLKPLLLGCPSPGPGQCSSHYDIRPLRKTDYFLPESLPSFRVHSRALSWFFHRSTFIHSPQPRSAL